MGKKNTDCVFSQQFPLRLLPLEPLEKMSDADNWLLSCLQTRLLTSGENLHLISVFLSLALCLIKIFFTKNHEVLNTHNSNKHGNRIPFDGLSVWRSCVATQTLSGSHLWNQEPWSSYTFPHKSDICTHPPPVIGKTTHAGSRYRPQSLTLVHNYACTNQTRSTKWPNQCARQRLQL